MNAARTVFTAGIAFMLSAVFSSDQALATYNYQNWDPNADAGSYGPIALGEDIQLDACGSTFYNYYNWSQSYSLCQLTDLSAFTLTWKAYYEGSWTWLGSYSGGNASSGLNVSQATGAGTFFSDVGTYYIGLYVAVQNNTYVPLPGGGYAFTSYYNTDFDWSSAFAISEPITLPEPSAIFALAPALLVIAMRERRRRRRHQLTAAQ